MKDLLLLVADKNAHFALNGALARPAALGIKEINFEVRVHVGRDGGARKSGPEMLALERRRFSHALLVLDFEASGQSSRTRFVWRQSWMRALCQVGNRGPNP
jgi:hypothetical protein